MSKIIKKRTSRKGISRRTSRKGISRRTSRKGISRRTSRKGISRRTSRKGISRRRTSRKGISREEISRIEISSNEISSNEISQEYLKYKSFMDSKPNDTVYRRWGMYTHDPRYKDYTASIVNMIKKDMNINTDQAYYMLYYMVSNNITDYDRAKRDMYIDENFEMYRTKGKREV